MTRGVALSFAVLLAVFEIGTCLKCYQCNSASYPECKDGLTPPSKFIVDCDQSASSSYNRQYLNFIVPPQFMTLAGANQYCFKVVDMNGVTARTCMHGSSLNEVSQLCNAAVIGDKKFAACSYCEKDNCNGSSAISASLPVALIALVASYLFYKQ